MIESIGRKLVDIVIKGAISNIGQNISDNLYQEFFNGIENYINNYYDKFCKTKTFIYRDERVNFYDIYYPVNLRTGDGTLISDIDTIFSREYITIVGSAGSGKSMLTKHLFLHIVNKYQTLPILIELRNLNDYNGSITDYIYSLIFKNKLGKNDRIIEKILNQGNFTFIFDGYDEIFSENKDKITNDIEEFVDIYYKNKFIITSRPGANAESLQRFDNLYVQPLNSKQINEFIALQFKNHDNKDAIGKIISVIEKPENKDYQDYLSSPLLLSMFIFTFNNYPELPKTKSKFYWNVFDTLCTKHDTFTKKGFWLHERKSKLKNDEFEKLLKWLSYITLFQGKYNFDENYLKEQINKVREHLGFIDSSIEDIIYDLSVSISILIQDGTDYTFPHKSLQEYFTAMLIKELNEEDKKDIYINKFNTLRRLSLGGNNNLYKLCYEIDKSAFLEYFILKGAEDFLTNIDTKDIYTISRSILRELQIHIGYNKNNRDEIGVVRIGYSILLEDSFFSFLLEDPKYVIKLFPSISDDNQCSKDIIKMLGKNGIMEIDFRNQWNDDIIVFLENIGALEKLKSFYDETVSKVIVFREEMNRERSMRQDLLNIL